MKILCTFSGKIGDILWSLPTVRALREISEQPHSVSHPNEDNLVTLDFGIMPQYKSLLPLLTMQSYIDNAFTINDWECIGSPCGDQPWEPQHVPEGYDKVFHLTYQRHPSSNEALIDFIAAQQGLKLTDPIVPFIHASKCDGYYIAYAFNELYKPLKDAFLQQLQLLLIENDSRIMLVDSTKLDWVQALSMIKSAVCFVGCRSSNYVIANGVGQRNIFIYEPHPSRNMTGPLGYTFSNPHATAIESPLGMPPEQSAVLAYNYIKELVNKKENNYVAV